MTAASRVLEPARGWKRSWLIFWARHKLLFFKVFPVFAGPAHSCHYQDISLCCLGPCIGLGAVEMTEQNAAPVVPYVTQPLLIQQVGKASGYSGKCDIG